RLRRREAEAAARQLAGEKCAPADYHVPGALPVGAILERGECGDLSETVHVVGRAHAIEPLGDLGGGYRVADAQAGEPRDLRKRPQQDEAGVVSQQCDAVGILGIVTEVAVGLAEEGQWRVVAESVEEG